ncbi:hypothetical protein D9M68_482220 [compost metagenome]
MALHPGDVVVAVGRERGNRHAGIVAKALERGRVHAREHAHAVLLDKAVGAAAQRAAALGTDRQHHRLAAPAACLDLERAHGGGLHAVGQEQDGAGHLLMRKRRVDGAQRERRVLARRRHDAGLQRIDEGLQQRGVVGQRQHQVRGAGVGPDSRAPAVAAREQRLDLEFRAFEPRGRHVDGIHGRRQVDGNRQRRLVVKEWRTLALPRGTGQRNGAKRKQQRGQVHGADGQPAPLAHHQCVQQVRGDRVAPAAPHVAAATHRTHQQHRRDQHQQPPRAQEMEIRERLHHGSSPAGCGAPCRRGRDSQADHSAMMSWYASTTPTAAPSGHMNSSRRGRHDSVLWLCGVMRSSVA